MTDIDLEDLYKMDAFGRLKFALAKDSIVARNWGDDKTAIDVTGDIETLITEVEGLRELAEGQDHKLLEVCKLAYRKHWLDDDRIGWEELGSALLSAICEAMGDENFQKWLKLQTPHQDSGD